MASGRIEAAGPSETPISRRKAARPAGKGSTGAEFDRFDLRPELLAAIADAGYESPRPIQAEALPPALAGEDVLGLAQTGTGKTAAFVLPILQRFLAKRRSRECKGPRALVLVPTRELAAQVQLEFERLAAHTPLSSIAVFGGVPVPRHVKALRARPDVVVACPGRLLDLIQRGNVSLDGVEVLVLDEADHMFDMGFLPDIRRILGRLPVRRQNLLFSASMPREIRSLANAVLKRPAVVELANSRPAETIRHGLLYMDEGQKERELRQLLGGEDFSSAIVFLRTKRRARQLAQRLDRAGHAAVALQGNMSQAQRVRAMRGFREGKYDVLVATDIAARGLDIDGVSHVVNYDLPNVPEAYTHRIGRTGRAEREGRAFTFVTQADKSALKAIEKVLGERIESWGGRKSKRDQQEDPWQRAVSRSGRGRQREPQRSSPKGAPSKGRRSKAASNPAREPAHTQACEPAAPPAPAFGSGVADSSPLLQTRS